MCPNAVVNEHPGRNEQPEEIEQRKPLVPALIDVLEKADFNLEPPMLHTERSRERDEACHPYPDVDEAYASHKPDSRNFTA